MQNEGDATKASLAAVMTLVREFVERQLRAGHRADALCFALTQIAAEMGLHVTGGRNPVSVVQTVLNGLLAAASGSVGSNQAGHTAGTAPDHFDNSDELPKGTTIH